MTFKKGDIVICTGSRGYNFTAGKEYVIIDYSPECYESNAGGFTWPAYVQVADDAGKVVTCHARRFKPKDD